MQAVALYGAGVAINVPAPERYCLHKLIVSRRRMDTSESQAKSRKDLQQASELIVALANQKPYELRDAWEELHEHGASWRKPAAEAFALLPEEVRKRFEQVAGKVEVLDGVR